MATAVSSPSKRRRIVSIFDDRTAINPGTLIRLSHADASTPKWSKEIGRIFMVGFYSADDGIDCIWLVNQKGEYEQTADRKSLLEYFTIVKPSRLTDYYGKHEKLPRWPAQAVR